MKANQELEAIKDLHTDTLGYSSSVDDALPYQHHRRMYDYKPDEVPMRVSVRGQLPFGTAPTATNVGFPNRRLPKYPTAQEIANNKRLTKIGKVDSVEHPTYPLKRDDFGKPVNESGFYLHEGKWGEVPIDPLDPNLIQNRRTVNYL